MSSPRPILIMIPEAGSVMKDHSRLDLSGSAERACLISQHDLEDLESPGFDCFIDWVVQQRAARRQHLCAQCILIFPEILYVF